jgi:hypothetical protein
VLSQEILQFSVRYVIEGDPIIFGPALSSYVEGACGRSEFDFLDLFVLGWLFRELCSYAVLLNLAAPHRNLFM